ncbi:MAG: hypothetical protein DMG34_16085, partial [Acidobacteria bacterium]
MNPAVERALPRVMMKFFAISKTFRFAAAVLLPALLTVASAFAEKDPVSIVVGAGTTAPGGSHFSKDLTGILETRANLTLRLNTDLGSVRILQLERGATPTVRYSVHIETDAREPLASQLLERYTLNAKGTASGIEITGNLPQQVSRAANSAQFWVHFEVTVPASYGLDINTGAGDILTPDVGGAATLVTEGGNIVTGRLSMNSVEGSGRHGVM